MPIKTILAPIGGTPDSETPLELAFYLAKEFDAHIMGLHVRPDPRAAIPYIGEGMTADVVQQMCDAADKEGRERAEQAQTLFENFAARTGVPTLEGNPRPGTSARWFAKIGEQAEVVARFGRIADVTIVGRPADEPESGIKEGLLFRSGRPILFIPARTGTPFPHQVAVAWNGSVEASRAVGSAIPFLKRAANVKVLYAGETPAGAPSADALKAYFAFHDVKAELTEVQAHEDSTGEALLEKTHSLGADLLVMGAYTRSRLRQMLLGGVTSYMLDNADVPVFMAH